MEAKDLSSSQKRKVIRFEEKMIISAIIVFFSALIMLVLFVIIFLPPQLVMKENIFEIKKGMTAQDIGTLLQEKGIVRSKIVFALLAKISGRDRRVKAGFYYVERPLSLIDTLYRVTDGNNGLHPMEVTIQEGATIYSMGKLFEDKKMFYKEAFWNKAGLGEDHFANLPFDISESLDVSRFSDVFLGKPEGVGFEGFLFPDTYYFPPGVTPEDVVSVMIRNFNSKLTFELRDEIARQGKTIYDVIIMASIIEREAFDEKDASIISGILWKRVQDDYPLQVDAVLAYITGRGSRLLTVDDLEIDSPYNVYRRIGLPPTPISNPGLTSIMAAIYPEQSPYWYYLHDSRGRAHYAVTFDQHKGNKAKYIR